mmetsp:Transcript_40919/g.65766  ORF Transcript_40919/g.65766 Transcript_40919/m.65766 type:complete len:209 (+) Transcript_40919:919-1545(+)
MPIVALPLLSFVVDATVPAVYSPLFAVLSVLPHSDLPCSHCRSLRRTMKMTLSPVLLALSWLSPALPSISSFLPLSSSSSLHLDQLFWLFSQPPRLCVFPLLLAFGVVVPIQLVLTFLVLFASSLPLTYQDRHHCHCRCLCSLLLRDDVPLPLLFHVFCVLFLPAFSSFSLPPLFLFLLPNHLHHLQALVLDSLLSSHLPHPRLVLST